MDDIGKKILEILSKIHERKHAGAILAELSSRMCGCETKGKVQDPDLICESDRFVVTFAAAVIVANKSDVLMQIIEQHVADVLDPDVLPHIMEALSEERKMRNAPSQS
jgi:hypothetical protein